MVYSELYALFSKKPWSDLIVKFPVSEKVCKFQDPAGISLTTPTVAPQLREKESFTWTFDESPRAEKGFNN